jgi:hypothetical protein
MKYIKSINESIYRLFGKKTKELLTHFGITEKEYQSYIDIIDKYGYSEIKSKIPFYMDLVDDEYEIDSYDSLRKLIKFAEEKKAEMDKVEEFEDILLKWKEDPDSDIKINTEYHTGVIQIEFPLPKDMSSLSERISEISKRISMNKIKHTLISVSWDYNNGNDLTRIRLKVI